MSDKMPELKPCPFCGFNEPELEVDTGIVWCPNCRCESPRDREAWGVESDQVDLTPELWNRRTPAPGSVVVPEGLLRRCAVVAGDAGYYLLAHDLRRHLPDDGEEAPDA